MLIDLWGYRDKLLLTLLLLLLLLITIFKHGTISQYIKYLQKRKEKE